MYRALTTIGNEARAESAEENIWVDEHLDHTEISNLSMNNFEKLVKSNYTLITSKHTSSQNNNPSDCKHPEVIITDDDPFNVISLRGILKKLEYRTVEYFNGLKLVEGLKEIWQREGKHCHHCRGFKLILLDCNMPVMDGYEAVEILKTLISDGDLPLIPVIACTAYVHQNEKSKCFAAGFDGFVSKPIKFEKLKGILQKYIESENTDS